MSKRIVVAAKLNPASEAAAASATRLVTALRGDPEQAGR
jgi:hypothetical protein